jgi:hypothetical protein
MKTRIPGLIALLVIALAPAAAVAELVGDEGHLLEHFVNEEGRVDYAGLKRDRERLDTTVDEIERLERAVYDAWERDDRLAFWLNTYNILTLRLIVDHYPLQPAPGRQAYPANSIQQISGAWDRPRFVVMGEKRSLDEIEHKIIRAEFEEPRIHLALVCAAVSCPPLRREPYRGADLDAQLDDQARRFFGDVRNLLIDRDRNEVWASQIIGWFADDFAPGLRDSQPRDVIERRALRAIVSPHVDAEKKAYIDTLDYRLEFFEYDWTLNEQMK